VNRYRLKVVEVHTDYVWIDAESVTEAKAKAHEASECEFEYLDDIFVVEIERLDHVD